jgi:hypothetical protein
VWGRKGKKEKARKRKSESERVVPDMIGASMRQVKKYDGEDQKLAKAA